MIFYVGLIHHPNGIDDPRFIKTEVRTEPYLYIGGRIEFHTLEEFALFMEKYQLIYEAPDSLADYY